jgi:hypothetical protein
MAKKYYTVTVTPTLDTGAYSNGDVLFDGTEVKLPADGCKLINAQAIWNDVQAASEEILLFFFQNNTHALGTENDAPSITAAQIATNVFLGANRLVNTSSGEADLGTPSLLASNAINDTGAATASQSPIVLKSGATKGIVYVQGLLEVTGGITCAADSLNIVLHFEV